MRQWKEDIDLFLEMTNKHWVRMLMGVGVPSILKDIKDTLPMLTSGLTLKEDNFKRLVKVFNEMGYEIEVFPKEVKEGHQNISIKFSLADLNLGLTTNFLVNKSFDEAYKEAEEASLEDQPQLKCKVLNLNDLTRSKIKARRPKDLADVQQLRRINNKK
tara:strand:- start:1615 stop:2091 length:477 start_codon:yes stop_codon:yes gene_type:complete